MHSIPFQIIFCQRSTKSADNASLVCLAMRWFFRVQAKQCLVILVVLLCFLEESKKAKRKRCFFKLRIREGKGQPVILREERALTHVRLVVAVARQRLQLRSVGFTIAIRNRNGCPNLTVEGP